MRLMSIAALASASLFLAGCMTESNYNRAQEIVRGSPAAKRDGVNKCYAGARRASPARKAEMAKIMNVSPAGTSPASIASARLTASPAAASPTATSGRTAPASSG
ncbi:hypothetical protein [Thauera sp. SDU_THAU2]|uniref:hypothetical protein n=1 Tax=Thauera sp. SDU_THAU2 TaxID=3136633 RepID=UPI00311FCED0